MATCETCYWWDWIAEVRGSCRRRAPLVTGGMMSAVETVWPETDENDWCGEHQPKENADASSD